MSWFCETCDHVFETDEMEPRQCRACSLAEYAAETESELDRMTRERNYWRELARESEVDE